MYGSVLIDNKDSIKKLRETDKRARDASKTFKNMGKTVKKMGKVAAIGVAGAGTALMGLASKASETADAIHKGSQRMGVSTKAYQELEYWASQNGLAQQQLEKGVGRLNQRMGMAVNGNKKYSGALEKLGINMDDVKDGTISTEDAFTKSIETLSGMENEQEKAALATEMFGTKLARDLLPTLQDGSLGLEDAKKKAEELGIVVGEDSINSGVKFSDTMDDMKRSLGGIATKVGLAVLPKVQQFLDWVTDNMPLIKEKMSEAMEKGKEVVDKLKDAFGFLKDKADILIPVLSGLLAGIVAFKVITTITNAIRKMRAIMTVWKASTFAQTLAQRGLNTALLANPIGLVVAAIAVIIAIGVALWRNWDTVKEKAQELWSKFKDVFTKIKGAVVEKVTSMKDSFTESMQKIKDFGSRILTTIKDFFVTTWENIKSKTIDKVIGMVTSVRSKFDDLKSRLISTISTMWNNIKDTFTTRISDIVGEVKALPGKLADGIKKGAGALKKAMKDMWVGAVKAVASPVNKIIGGANWILGKFGSDKKIAKWTPYAKGTDGHLGGAALVNDQKGGTYREAIQFPNGETVIPKGRNVLFPDMPKGTKVLPANQTKKLYKYKDGIGDWASGVWDKAKSVGSKVKNFALDIWDYAKNPSKLVNKIVSKFVDYQGMGGAALDMGKGLIGKAKGSMKSWAKKLFDDNEGSSVMGGIGFPSPFRKTSKFGWRTHPIFGTGRMHTGVDMAAPSGTNVFAQKGGTVTSAGRAGGYGNLVRIKNGIMEFLYAHLSKIMTSAGKRVKQGQLIGKVGSTGNSTGPHLHYETRRNGRPVYPGYSDGGLVDKHQLAQIAEGNKPEMVIPLTKPKRAKELIGQAKDHVGINEEIVIPITLELDGETLVKKTINITNRELKNINVTRDRARGRVIYGT